MRFNNNGYRGVNTEMQSYLLDETAMKENYRLEVELKGKEDA